MGKGTKIFVDDSYKSFVVDNKDCGIMIDTIDGGAVVDRNVMMLNREGYNKFVEATKKGGERIMEFIRRMKE
jgi:hypothetical protein